MIQTFDHTGRSYKSITAKCDRYNIPPHIYRIRINDLGWTEEEALTTPVQRQGSNFPSYHILYHGKMYSSVAEFCRAYEIKVNGPVHQAIMKIAKDAKLDQNARNMMSGKIDEILSCSQNGEITPVIKTTAKPENVSAKMPSTKEVCKPSLKSAAPFVSEALKNLRLAGAELLGKAEPDMIVAFSKLVSKVEDTLVQFG